MKNWYAVTVIIAIVCGVIGYLLYHKQYENEPCFVYLVEDRTVVFPYHNDLLFIADDPHLYTDSDRMLIYSLGVKWLKNIDMSEISVADKAYISFIVEKLNMIVDSISF